VVGYALAGILLASFSEMVVTVSSAAFSSFRFSPSSFAASVSPSADAVKVVGGLAQADLGVGHRDLPGPGLGEQEFGGAERAAGGCNFAADEVAVGGVGCLRRLAD
jgi:hypothetical protein